MIPSAADPAAAPTLAGKTPKSEARGGAALASDFETFLTLLTAQMRNQDPLKPVESTEFVAQLASFSAVEQQIRTNDQLGAIFDAMVRGEGAGLADWIGREVRTEAARQHDAGAEIPVEVDPAPGATRAELVALDASGAELARQSVDPRATELLWAGRSGDAPLPAGRIRFEVAHFDDDQSLGRAPARTSAVVRELRFEDGQSRLVIEGGMLSPSEVSRIGARSTGVEAAG